MTRKTVLFSLMILIASFPSLGDAELAPMNEGLFGGEILALTALSDGRLLAATYYGAGLFHSEDGGESWIPVADAPAGRQIQVLAATGDDTVFAGGLGTGVYVSMDGGLSWERRSNGLETHMSRLVRTFGISPAYAADETIFLGTYDGLYVTDNWGEDWALADERFAGKGVFGVGVSPDFLRDRTLFITVEGEGVYLSSDAGRTWVEANGGLPDLWVEGIAVSPGFGVDRTLFVGTGGALCKSNDGGATWRAVKDGGVSKIYFSPTYETDRTVYCISSSKVHRSTDGGESWAAFHSGLPDPPIWDLALFGSDVYAATYGAGVYRYDRESEEWVPTSRGIVPQINSLAISPGFPSDRTIYAGTWGGGVFTSRDGGGSWEEPALAGEWMEGLAISPDYASDGTIYAATSDYVYRSLDHGRTWERKSEGITNRIVSAIAISPFFHDDGTVFVGTRGNVGDGVFRTIDRGETWRQVNTGILETVEHASVWALAVSPDYANDRTVFAGLFYNGGLFRTTDGGDHWTQVIPEGNIIAVAVSPNYADDGTLFAASLGEGVYRSTDRGETWEKVLSEEEARYVYDIAFSPNCPEDGTVYLAAGGRGTFNSPTGGGLWRSRDGGDTWERLSDAAGLDTIVLDPADPEHLFLGTCADGVLEYREAP